MSRPEEATVLAKRTGHRHEDDLAVYDREANIAFVSESLRNSQPNNAEPSKGDEKISVFWRVFGGTILSITALVVIQAYQSLNSNLHELRSDQNRLRELSADFVKKDEFGNRTTNMWNRVQELQSISTNLSVASNKLTTLEQQFTGSERERKELHASVAQLALLKDRCQALEEQRKVSEQDHKELLAAAATIQALKDKDAALEKQLRDAETERKDLVRELQTLRERLAKLEGQQSPGKLRP